MSEKLGYKGDLYTYLTPESGYKYARTIAKQRVQVTYLDGVTVKGQLIGNTWCGDECGVRTVIHGDDDFVHLVASEPITDLD